MILQKAVYHRNFFYGLVRLWADFYCFLRLGKLQVEKTCFILPRGEKTLEPVGNSVYFLLEDNFY